jgi:hypothetical protein
MEKTVLRRFISIAAIMASIAPCAAEAKSDSLCVRISGSEPGVFITLSRGYSMTGALPVSFCELEREATYRLILDGVGFERRIGSFSIVGGRPRVGGVQGGVAAKNMVLPGWGSVSAGRVPAAVTDDIGIAASLGWLLYEELEYDYMRERYDELTERYWSAETWAERARLQNSIYADSRLLNIQNDQCTRLAVLAGALYAWQVIEPLFLDRPPKTLGAATAGELTLRGAHTSRAKAFILSTIRPGRGQFYQGKTGRGAFFSLATFAMGFVALEYQTEYEFAVSDYEVCVERFYATNDVSEQEKLKSDAGRYWDHVEHEKGRRGAAFIVLAGLWGWNMIDTLFPAEHLVSEGKYSFDIDARGASVAMRF